MLGTVAIIFGFSLASLILSWLYFRRYRLQRPPLGVFNLWDIAIMLGGILLIPYLYLLLPRWLVTGLLGLGVLGILYVLFEAIWHSARITWLLTLFWIVVTPLVWWQFGARSPVFLIVNNIVQVMAVIGITNLWAQSGLKARDAAILGGALVVYDLVFTSFLPLMGDIFAQLEGLPFAPVIAWPVGEEMGLIGLGDLLLAAVFPLVMYKAYSRTAGLAALALSVAALAAVFVLPFLLPAVGVFPVMVVLGPLMVLQYLYWRRRLGRERTMQRYWQDDPPSTGSEVSQP